MKSYSSAAIRNVALVGHGGAGKTTLTEALLHLSGAIGRPGRVEDAATVTDFEPEEHKRGLSISAALAPVEWEGHKINLIDAPGYADFAERGRRRAGRGRPGRVRGERGRRASRCRPPTCGRWPPTWGSPA